MITVKKLALRSFAALALAGSTVAEGQIITSNVVFPRGGVSTVIAGMIRGDQTRDYVVRAAAGQTLRVRLNGAPIVFFNVLPPGSNDQSIFTGSDEGNSFSGTLSASGAYKIRVYQMRATARRGQAGGYRLSISVEGRGAGMGPGMGMGGGMGAGNGLAGLNGMKSINAIDVMSNRGFRNVDSFSSGNTQYGIFFNPRTRVCAQLTMADTRVVDARDIRTHPKCR